MRVTSTTAFGRAVVLPMIARLMEEHPDVRVDLSLSDAFVDLVGEGFDYAVRGGVLPVNDYVSRLLLPVTPLVCASPDYLEAHGTPTRIEQLARHRCVGMRSNPSQSVFAWEFARGSLPIKVDIEAALIVNDPQAAAEAAVASVGLAQVGSNVVLPLVDAGELVVVLQRFAIASRGLYAVYPTRRYLPRRVSALIDALYEHCHARADLTLA